MPEATILLLGGSGSWFMREFLHKTPFSDEINGDSQKHEGTRTVGDVDCDVIYVVYSEGTGEARWYFGRKDHLPRRVDRKRGKDGYTVQIVKNLDVSPDLSPSDFRLKRPKGYAVKEFEPPPPPPPPELLAVGSPAPDWELKDAGGRTVSLKSLRGNVVVMDFWATWCGPCKMAMPGIEKVHQAFKDQRVRIYGVNCWEKGRGDPVAYMKKKKYTYGLLLEGDKVAEAYKVRGIPTFYVIDPEGKIAYAASGFAPGHEKKLSQTIKKIVMAPNL